MDKCKCYRENGILKVPCAEHIQDAMKTDPTRDVPTKKEEYKMPQINLDHNEGGNYCDHCYCKDTREWSNPPEVAPHRVCCNCGNKQILFPRDTI